MSYDDEDRHENRAIFLDAWTDYALISAVFKLAHFRSVFGDIHHLIFLSSLELGSIPEDVVDKTGEQACASLKALFDVFTKRYQCHKKVIFQRYIFVFFF